MIVNKYINSGKIYNIKFLGRTIFYTYKLLIPMFTKFSILFLSLISFSLLAQDEEKKYELERLTRQKNHIRQILTYEFGRSERDSSLVEHNFYDSTGNLIRRQSYDAGRLQYKGMIAYDERGLMTKEAGYDGAGNLMQIFVYDHDKDGHRTEYKQLDPTGKVLNHQKSVYNSKGQRIKVFTQIMSMNDKPYMSAAFSYNKTGLPVRFEMYSPYGDLGSVYQYEYDANGNLIATYNLVNNEKKLYYTQQYNAKQQLVETAFYQENQSFSGGKFDATASNRRERLTYDSDGNLIEETTWNGTALIKRVRYYFKKTDS